MATRFYFPENLAPSVSPAVDAGWGSSSGLSRWQLVTAKQAGDALGFAVFGGSGISQPARQYVSGALEAQTISGTVKCQLRARNVDAGDTVTPRLSIRVVSNDGSTVRGTLLTLGDYSATAFSTVSDRNKIFADGDALSSVNAQAGDRLVVEIGAADNLDEWRLSVGAPSSASDLPENETETGALVPWIEFSGDLTFQAAAAGAPNLLLLGVG